MTILPIHRAKNRSVILSALLFVAACSGSGDPPPRTAPPPPPPPPPASDTIAYTAGVFRPSSDFKDRCEVVRTGVDFEGNPFTDIAGSTAHENFWLRSWTDETYLWNDEVVDRNPNSFNDPIAYFNLLRTTELTASGMAKDEFHFSQATDDFLRARNSAPLAGYGAEFIAFSTVPPRDFRVLFTEPNSPASQVVMGEPNLVRGTRILEINGIDVINANTQNDVNQLNSGLFPPNSGVTNTFLVQDPGGSPRTIMMTSADISEKPVNRFSTINTPTGPVGYMLLNTFSPFASEKDIADTITALAGAGVNDLVLDLRYNGGGLLAVAAQLGFMIAGDARSNGKIYEQLQFNADAGNLDPVTGQVNEPFPFISTGVGFSLAAGTPLDSLDLPRVFLLSTSGTCSASETIINGLRGIDVEVILIGDTTCGKPFGFTPQDNCGTTFFTIQFRGLNDKGFGDYADGFTPMNSPSALGVKIPGCEVSDNINFELGDVTEPLLATALSYRENGSCPAAATATITTSTVETPVRLRPVTNVMAENKDIRMPN